MIRRYLENLPGGRAQLYADLIGHDGEIEATYPIGSPAPRESILSAFDIMQRAADEPDDRRT